MVLVSSYYHDASLEHDLLMPRTRKALGNRGRNSSSGWPGARAAWGSRGGGGRAQAAAPGHCAASAVTA